MGKPKTSNVSSLLAAIQRKSPTAPQPMPEVIPAKTPAAREAQPHRKAARRAEAAAAPTKSRVGSPSNSGFMTRTGSLSVNSPPGWQGRAFGPRIRW